MTKFNEMTSTELKSLAKERGIKSWWTMKKAELITYLEELETNPPKFIVINMAEGTHRDATEEDIKKAQEKKTKKSPKPLTKEVNQSTEKAETDIITLKEIAAKLKIRGMKARRILRKAGIARFSKRWEWSRVTDKELIEKIWSLLK